MLRPKVWNAFRRSRLNSGSRSRLASGSTRTKPETSVRSRPPSTWRGAIPTSLVWSWAMRRCSGTNTPRPNLSEIIRRVKRDSPVPVATAEHWKNFIDHPELVDAVDQVFAHIIPYWEGYAKRNSRSSGPWRSTTDCRRPTRARRSSSASIGWPSAGHNFERAVPGPISQARRAARLRCARQRARHRLQYRRGDRSAGKACSRAMSALIGASSMHRCGPNLPGRDRWLMPTTGRRRGCAVLVGSLLSLSILVLPGSDHWPGGSCLPAPTI